MTTTDLIIAAIQRLTADNSLPSPDDVATGLLRLNDLLDAWKIEGLTVYTYGRTTWALTGAANYTVGPTGTVAITRPSNGQALSFAFIDTSVTPSVEMPLASYTDEQYDGIQIKALTSTYPQGFFYDPTSPLGTLTPWPVPTSSTLTGVIYAPSPAGELALTDTLTLPAGYRRFYRDNLAVELAPDFGLQPSAALVQSATDSKATVKKSNVRPTELENEAAALGNSSSSAGINAFYAGP